MCPPRTALISPKQKVEGRGAEDFPMILARCLADLAAGRATIEACLQRYPAQAGRLAAILPIAERARAVSLLDQSSTAAHSKSPATQWDKKQ